MNKQKIVFLSNMAFDANVSIIKRLTEKYDVYFLPLCNHGIFNRIGKFKLSDDIVPASNIYEFHKLKSFIDLNKTYLLKHYSYEKQGLKCIYRKISIDRKVRKLILKINPKAIICDSYDMPLTRFCFRKKIILLKHDPFPHSGEDTIMRKIMDWSMHKCAARYVLFNKNQRTQFINYFHIDPSKVFVAFLSVYEMLYLYDNQQISVANEKDIFFWGRISKYKGIDYLIEGFKKYIKKTGDQTATLTIAGKGAYHFDVDVAVNGCTQISVIKRYLSMEEMVTRIKKCCFVVCPYTDATQSGVIMSAFAMKKTVLATNVGGLPEMLDNGKTGMLIKPKDSDAICAAIEYLYTHPKKIDEYTKNIGTIYFGDGEKRALPILSVDKGQGC